MNENIVTFNNKRRDIVNTTQEDVYTTATKPYIQDGPTASRSMYALYCLVANYSIMFLKRLCKDLFQSVMIYFYSDRALPDHIVDLKRVQKRLQLLRGENLVTYSHYRFVRRNFDPSNPEIPILRVLNNAASEEESENSLDYYFSWNSLHSDTSVGYFTSVRKHRGFVAEAVSDPEFEKAIKFLHSDNALIMACEFDDNNLIQELISEGVDVNLRDPIGRTALHFAVQNGNIIGIKMLLEAGAYTTIRDYVGLTPLQICVMRRPSVEVAKLLFSYGAVILPRVKPLSTGLFLQFAMMCIPTPEETELLALLLEHGALINDPNVPGGRSALHFAAMSNNRKLIHVLIDLGADVFATNHRGETPYDVAVIFKCKDAIQCLKGLMHSSQSEEPVI